jgi:SNF2 family DNA or RNA helicase
MSVKIYLENGKKKEVRCCFSYVGKENFNLLVTYLKSIRSKFNKSSADWTISPSRLTAFVEYAEEFEVIDRVGYKTETELLSSLIKPELKISEVRQLYKPDLVKLPLLDFQVEDAKKCINRNRFYLALKMGMGKSAILAAVIAHHRLYSNCDKVLFITSNTGVYNLKKELIKFINISADDIEIGNAYNKKCFETSKPIVITSYDSFRRISDYYAREVNKNYSDKYQKPQIPLEDWIGSKQAILILDEAHKIGNHKSKQSNAIKVHADFFEYRYLASGTPADKIEKWYLQLKILDEALVKNLGFSEWLAEYAVLGTHFSEYQPQYYLHNKIKGLMEHLRANYVSFRKLEDHIKLPENLIRKIYVEMNPLQLEIYEEFITSSLSEIYEKCGSLDSRQVTNSFPYLSMALDNPQLLEKHSGKFSNKLNKNISKWDFLKDHAKIELCDELVEKHCDFEGQKIIIWTNHPSTADILKDRYKKYEPTVINGVTAKTNELKTILVDQFRESKESKILIAGISVLSTSQTIVEAKAQIYFERNYNYTDFDQSKARIHRIGQNDQVNTYILLFDNSLDILQDKNLEDKDLITNMIGKQFLTKEQWRKIFKLNSDDKIDF